MNFEETVKQMYNAYAFFLKGDFDKAFKEARMARSKVVNSSVLPHEIVEALDSIYGIATASQHDIDALETALRKFLILCGVRV